MSASLIRPAVNEMLKPSNRMNLVVAVLLIIFISFKIKIPDNIGAASRSVFMQAALAGLAIYLFTTTHPIVGTLFVIASYELLNRSTDTSMFAISQFIPGESKKKQQMDDMNGGSGGATEFHSTLEAQQILGAIPLAEHSTVQTGVNYMPAPDVTTKLIASAI